MNQSKKITDAALLTAVYLVILLIAFFIPIIGLVALLFLAIPFIMYTEKYGAKSGLLMLLVASLLSMIFATIISLPITLLFGIGGITIGAALHQEVRPYEVWARGTIGFIAGILVVLLIGQFVLNVNVYEQFDAATEDSMKMVERTIQQLGLSGKETDALLEQTELQMQNFRDLLPSSIAILGIVFAFFSQWLSYKVINRLEQKSYQFPPFIHFNLPISIIWFYLITLLVSLFSNAEDNSLYIMAINVITLLSVLLIIQGFSFLFFYAKVKKWPKAVPYIFLGLSVIFPFLLMFIMRFIGILDIGLGMKKKIGSQQ